MKIIYGTDISAICIDAQRLGGGAKHASNCPKGFDKLRSWGGPEPGHWVMEATGNYHLAFANYLLSHGHQVSVVNPRRACSYAESLGKRNKTDACDAQTLAEFASANELPLYQPLPDWQRELRSLMRFRENLVERRASMRVQLQDPGIDPFVKEQTEDGIDFTSRQIQSLEKRIQGVIDAQTEVKKAQVLLTSIPGVGKVLGWFLLAELGLLDQFYSAKKAAAFVGVCPAERRSGKMRWATHMSKAGNASLRKALYMPAMASIRTEGPFKALFQRLVQSGKAKMCAIGAVMHKLVRIAFGVLKSGCPFMAEGACKTL